MANKAASLSPDFHVCSPLYSRKLFTQLLYVINVMNQKHDPSGTGIPDDDDAIAAALEEASIPCLILSMIQKFDDRFARGHMGMITGISDRPNRGTACRVPK